MSGWSMMACFNDFGHIGQRPNITFKCTASPVAKNLYKSIQQFG